MFHLFIHHLSSLEQNREQSFGLTSNFASDNKLSQENQQKNVLSKILLNDGDSYDVTIPPPDSDEYEKREYFDTAEAKTFKISSSPGNIAILIFKNPKEFTLENGDQIKPFYSSINQNEIILKIKALKLYTSLEYYWQEFTYSPDMYVNIIMNVANFSYEFPQLQNFHLIYAYTQTAEIMHKDIYSDGKSNGGGTLTYEHEIPKGHYFVSVKISDNTISDDVTSGIFNVENCLSAMDYAQKSVLLYPFKLYSLKVDSTPIKYVVCEFGFKHFVVLAKNGIKQVDNHTEDSSYLSSTNGQQDVLALFIPIDSYSFKVKYSVNTISDQALSYYIEEEEISMMLI
ncbi:hypothetical protein TVAG_224250 [Trichomonas vaginalis G3]|uniref:Uncharacterized protein n=1 Tax=Trichomonas vaginalis (strain ATCC PRA-98 / G3) TaxID=412133 RepID=A2DW48_TRIV3|nr:hypothetical protein TVAG_224250 [Trichomonas vaginalis G3]|eukprot:XP_001327572.1 hypothetical protein [Trichomonas vaginalis G3]